MLDRYTTPAMKKIWSDKTRFEHYLEVEKAVAKAYAETGVISALECADIMDAKVNLGLIRTIEKRTHHDVISFIESITTTLGVGARVFHYGLTSTDIVDTAHALILQKANALIMTRINGLQKVLRKKAFLYKELPCIGRTHGIHAEVTSFGLKFALWFADLDRIKTLFGPAAGLVETGKISGAVGNYAAISPAIEDLALKSLSLQGTKISTQTLQRDRHAAYISALALIGSELDKIATEIRHLSRTEVGEVMEAFSSGQKGSSAMPHKRNPVRSENISGLSRVLRGHVVTAFENIALWHERDLSHSAAERIILRDATTLVVFMLERMTSIIDQLVVFPAAINANIGKTYGAIFAQAVMNKLIDHGINRLEAYDIVQKASFEALDAKTPMKDILLIDKRLIGVVDSKCLDDAFSYHQNLAYVPLIFNRVFS